MASRPRARSSSLTAFVSISLEATCWPPATFRELSKASALALSEARLRALSILHPAFPLAPAIFAHYMWPASPSWTRATRAGTGIRSKAGTFLACLERDGLVRRYPVSGEVVQGYVLTRDGAIAVDYKRGADASVSASGE